MAAEFRGFEPRAKLSRARDHVLGHAARAGKSVNDGQRLEPAHDAAVAEAAPHAKKHNVAQARRAHLARAGEKRAEIAFLAAMQKPVARIWTRIEWRNEPEVAKDADQQHRAVDARALYVGRMVIWRP